MCHTNRVIFEARSSALAPYLALKRYYELSLMCQLRKSCKIYYTEIVAGNARPTKDS